MNWILARKVQVKVRKKFEHIFTEYHLKREKEKIIWYHALDKNGKPRGDNFPEDAEQGDLISGIETKKIMVTRYTAGGKVEIGEEEQTAPDYKKSKPVRLTIQTKLF